MKQSRLAFGTEKIASGLPEIEHRMSGRFSLALDPPATACCCQYFSIPSLACSNDF